MEEIITKKNTIKEEEKVSSETVKCSTVVADSWGDSEVYDNDSEDPTEALARGT